VFIRPVNLPHAHGLPTGLGCDVDEAGFVVVDATGRTSISGADPRFAWNDPHAHPFDE
jgi:hypothetical protein